MLRNKKIWDDIHARSVIIGVTNLLQNKIKINYLDSSGNEVIKTIPFFYSATGDSRFLQDYFDFTLVCNEDEKIDSNFDVIPRGMVVLESCAINTSSMTNRFVRGEYLVYTEDGYETRNSVINSIPLDYNIKIIIQTDLHEDIFKIMQSFIENFYKTQVFSFQYKGFRIPAQIGFPEEYGLEKTFQFSYPETNKNSLTFSFKLETYFPVIDETTEFLSNNVIESFNLNSKNNDSEIRGFTFTNITPDTYLYSGKIFKLKWKTFGIIPFVNLYFSIDNGESWKLIEKNIKNLNEYDWLVPYITDNETTNEDPINIEVISKTGRGAKLRVLVRENGEIEQVLPINRGYGYKITDSLIVEPKNPSQNFVEPVLLTCVDENGGIAHANIVSRGAGLPYLGEKYVQFKIVDSYNEETQHILSYSPIFTGNQDPDLIFDDSFIFNIFPELTNELVEQLNIKEGDIISSLYLEKDSRIKNINFEQNIIVINTIINKSSFGLEYRLEERPINIKIF